MYNLFTTTEFIKHLVSVPANTPFVFFVEEGKSYRQVVNGLTATAVKFKINLTTDQVLIVEHNQPVYHAVKVTRKENAS